jgi:hypothetical protein
MVSKALEKATQQFRAGQFKKASDSLWEVSFAGDDGEAEAQALLALASQLRAATEGAARGDCEEHIARAQRYLGAGQRGESERREAELLADPVTLARRARDAGLTWLTMTSSDDLVAASLLEALRTPAGSTQGAPCVIDAVEAEGWHLEHITRALRPVRVQASPFGAADLIAGGQGVDSVEEYQYVFRRVDGMSG